MDCTIINFDIQYIHNSIIRYLTKYTKYMNIRSTLLLLMMIPTVVFCQSDKLNIGLDFVKSNLETLKLTDSDISEVKVSDMYTTKHNGVTHIYFMQYLNGIPVHNAILNVNLDKNDNMLFHNTTFVSDIASKVNAAEAKLSPEESILYLADKLEIVNPEVPSMLKKDAQGTYTYAQTSYTKAPIEVKAKYYAVSDNEVKLVWDVLLDDARNDDVWSTRIDAVTGQILNHENRTVYCNHAHGAYHNHSAACRDHKVEQVEENTSSNLNSMMMGASYRVYALPAESPLHGPHVIVTDPANPIASPFGWHDLDGVEGPEFTITRGNNVHAYEETDGDQISANNEPDGGADLVFDFVHDIDAEPEASLDADVTNLFYMNNMIHDITYLLGFDEAAGNYQSNNYGNGGFGGDFVIAHAVDDRNTDGTPGAADNANFTLSSDGNSGNMNMYKWNQPTAGLFSIVEPAPLAGFIPNGEAGTGWGFDPNYTGVDIEAEMAFAVDGDVQLPQNGCGDIVNGDEVEGKIALIYRGICEFGTKALNAQNAGAVAVIICNVPGAGGDPTSDGSDPISNGMGNGADGPDVTIPTIALGFQDCQAIQASIDAGFPVIGKIKPSDVQGVAQVSAGFDNGVIAHEYGHGISGRLVGGPNTVCVSSTDEQMGEGWSDFFALITTVRPDDLGADARGIGNYVDGRGIAGKGIRRFPYSTDMSVNPQTYKDIKATTAPHPLGEVWNDMIWDMYWSMVDLYGYDADWSNTTSGNHIAAKLVIDGMKMMGCNVGFITGRDAILAADMANNGGANQCLIWESFARRGLGFFADGGSTNNRNDGTENFDVRPSCINSLKIRKDIATLIEIDTETEVTLFVSNHKDEAQTNLVVTDFIPEGLTYVENSASIEATTMNDQIIFEYDTFESGQEEVITYRVRAEESSSSQLLSNNAVESSQELGQWQREIGEGSNLWRTVDASIFPTFSGNQAWYVAELDDDTKQTINFPNIEVTGALPVLRFWHRINTEFARNGGFVEISEDGVLWFDAKDKFIRNGYDCPLQYTTFAIPSHFAFSGRTDEYIDSWIDLSSYKDQTISVRFRFGTNSGDAGTVGNETFPADSGWFIDDVDMIDLVNLETQACVSTVTDQACTPFVTTIVNTSPLASSTEDFTIEGVEVTVFPNPAQDYYIMKIMSERSFDANISLLSIDGQLIQNKTISVTAGENQITTNTSHLPSGFYITQLRSGDSVINEKIFVD